jgi:predicted ATPase
MLRAMPRIVVLGCSGAGKSTLALALGRRLGRVTLLRRPRAVQRLLAELPVVD